MVNYYPSYLTLSEFTQHTDHECVCENISLRFDVFSKSTSLIDWSVLDDYIGLALPQIVRWSPSKPLPKTVRIKVFEDYTPKRLPRKGAALTPDHINSGLTYTYGDWDRTNIEIFRMQEFPKVLCHELLHFFNVGISKEQNDRLSTKVASVFNTPALQTINVNEALTELNAVVLNAAILSSTSLLDSLEEEYRHTEATISRIRDHFGLTSNDWSRWKETTHAFSYLVLRHLFMGELLGHNGAFNCAQKSGEKEFTMTKAALIFKKLT